MTTAWASAPLAIVRHLIADDGGRLESIANRIGEIELRTHQRRAADRLLSIIAKHGGAMLAEPVGLGKTYTALAVAARCGGRIVVVAPASLRDMWRGAAQRCGIDVTIATYESLSRGSMPGPADFVIADEAHRLRSPGTLRYAAIAELSRRARLLLVTATPVHNHRGDLAAQLALFLGRVAWQMSNEQLTEYVVRNTGSALGARPRLDGPHRVSLDVTDDCLEHLLALPAPVPARDGSIAAALLTYGLLHQWTSSRAALAASLRRRRARGLALLAALESGRRPTNAELAAWTQVGDALQLAFPEIVTTDTPLDFDIAELLIAVDRHNAAVAALLEHLRVTNDPDDERAAALLRIRRAHPDERIIAFCQYAETVYVLRSKLAREPGVASLTANGARVAGGSISRADVIGQFAPSSRPDTHARDGTRIELLITTDLLSEGLNLQEASVIVHLDLPWNPARLDQRVGRAIRLGSRHEAVTVYMVAPPASAERLLRIESRLRDKLRVAQRTIGVAGQILPAPLGEVPVEHGLAEQRGVFESVLRGWRLRNSPVRDPRCCSIAAVRAERRGFLARVRTEAGSVLVADLGDGMEVASTSISRAITCAGSTIEMPVRGAFADEILQRLRVWASARRAAAIVDLGAAGAARARRTTLTRVAQSLARTPRHMRSHLAPLADAARAVASAPLGEGAERILETLAGAELPDEAWLRSIAAFGEINIRPSREPIDDAAGTSDIVAIILLEPGAGESGTE